MSRFLLIDSGEELGAATEGRLRDAAGPVALRLLDAEPPFREHQILHVEATGSARAARGIVLCRVADGYALRTAGAAAGRALARVVALEQRATLFRVGRGPLSWLPPRGLARALRVLELLNRFRHPLTPPLFLGSTAACLDGVRKKYGSRKEVSEYRRLALGGPEPEELEFVRAHVKPGARLLVIGCGAGREALGLARAGYRVTGIDLVPEMIDAGRRLAREAGLAIEFRVQDAADLDDPPGAYDAVYLGSPIHHIPGRARRIATLGRIHRGLAPDGVLLVIVAYRDSRPWSRSRLVDLCRRVGARLLGSDRVSEPGDGWMRDVSRASDPDALVFFHDFDGPADVRAELEAACFAGEEARPGWWACRPSARVA